MKVSQAEFARKVNVNRSTIYKAVRNGRLDKSIMKDKSGSIEIDLERGYREWRENRDDSKDNRATSETPSFNESRARREYYAAEMEKLKFEEKCGQLYPKKDVEEYY